VLIHLYCIFSI